MVICPECGKPLRRERESDGKYFCENKNCNLALVINPDQPKRMRVAYTGFTRYHTASWTGRESSKHPAKHKLKIF